MSNEQNSALAAEQEKSRILGNMTDGFRNEIKQHQSEYDRLSGIIEKDTLRIVELEQQLLAAQAAIAELQNVIEGEKISFNLHEQIRKCLRVDLSALDNHDAEVRKPLVDALEETFREGYREGYSNGSSDCANYNCGGGSKHESSLKREQDEAWQQSDALAKVKEGK